MKTLAFNGKEELMGRKVKCQDTGEYSTNDVAYKASNGKYYSSKDAYMNIKTNNEYRIKCIDEIMKILNYKEGMKLPTVTYKKLSEYEIYGFDVLLDTINSQHDAFVWALKNKTFNSETSKIFYLFAIIQNNIMESYKKKAIEEKQKVEEKRNELIVEDINVGTNQRSKNVSKLLGDDEWI